MNYQLGKDTTDEGLSGGERVARCDRDLRGDVVAVDGGVAVSWGHSIRQATADELYYRWAPDTHLRCSARRCTEPAHYLSRYYYVYVTGRGGRISYADRLLCVLHGKLFARRYQLELPQEHTDDQTAR